MRGVQVYGIYDEIALYMAVFKRQIVVQRAKDLLSERGAQREKARRQSGAKIGQRKSRESCTIGEIAEFCAFPDVFYFTRLFKKVTGVPPAKWR